MRTGNRDARRNIQWEWSEWRGKTGGALDKSAFYDWLVQNRPQLLRFQATGDKRKIVISWLGGSSAAMSATGR